MSEGPPRKPPEASRTPEEIEEDEMCAAYLVLHPVVEVIQASPEVVAEKIAEAEALLDSFEQTYDLDALRAITQFSSDEERKSSFRQPALDALVPIVDQLKHLHSQKAFPIEARDALRLRYERLSQSVGVTTEDKNGKVFGIVVHNKVIPFPS